MPGATLTTLSAILKEYYLPPVVEQLNNDVLFLNRLEKRDQELFGKRAYVPLHVGRSGGIGARPESGALPDPGNQVYDNAVFDLKYLYGRVRVTGPSMVKTSNEAGAFLRVLQSELDGVRNDLTKDLARQIWSNGDSIIAVCGVTSASTTVVLNASAGEAIDKGWLYEGMVIDIGTAASPTAVASARTITAINAATPSITIDGANVTTAATDRVFRSGSAAASAVSHEVSGIPQIVSTTATSFGGINPASAGKSYWDNLRDTSGGALSVDMMLKAFNRVRTKGGNLSAVVTSYGLQRAFFNLLQAQVRFTDPMTIKGGFQTLEFMGYPIIADVDAPWGRMYFLDESTLKVFSDRDWHFLDEDGNVLKWRSGFDEWEAVLARYINIGAVRRNNQFVISGLTDATGF